MATAPTTSAAEAVSSDGDTQPKRKSRRRKTAHLKLVPETRELRERLKVKCADVAAKLDRSHPLTKDQMENIARRALEEEGLGEGYVGWMMVVLSSEFWRDQVAHIPPSRRLFLLPHCLKHAEGCPADYDEFGLDCESCGACSIADFRGAAEKLGYKVLVAEGSPIVLKIIVSGHVDAITGVACLNVLEKAIDKILLAGIPCMAVPLLSSDCRNTSVDEEWVQEMIHVQPNSGSAAQTSSYLPLMRVASQMFEPEQLHELAPRARGVDSLSDDLSSLDPIAATEAIAYDFLAQGGKHSRPFITLAVHDALTGGHSTRIKADDDIAISDSIKRVAMSIETFHKASLVHDDIEDDDEFRYGNQAMHRRFGVPTAINVGDYLIGLGYRLVSRESAELGADVVADILDSLGDAHMRLSEGQGAELFWRDARDKSLKPIDALKIYALKTSPAFEAALYSGARLAGQNSGLREAIKKFARNIGVAFQILNDLKDWDGDSDNKLASGADILGGRPTLLYALALESLDAPDQVELSSTITSDAPDAERIARVRRLYEKANVFETAHRMVDKHQHRAEEVAENLESEELKRLFFYLIDTVLERPEPTPITIVATDMMLPITAAG